ncbi:metal dependent phosphohydrolase, putative [Heliomicrobium modesticaldum Ice1]|uniref:Metal dependent phosphohydrolase, putative n=1 Tax=Heliobacterium modesticaldum (strain ATCC 51547 / Ice1) TaxID=498761 RepID=B0TIK4_HELMI|nr:HD domain-containing protein [Heliomicrobium modesticaldum]ABZ84945.1 metal dependent phosphohydrolase, putative [Heliomicrobium modesticaldum Ice1]
MKTALFSRIRYRCRQVLQAWQPHFSEEELVWADAFLAPEERAVFLEMAPADRRHALDVAHLCHRESGELSPEGQQLLIKAALLHDMGKRNASIGLVHRVLYVLLGSWPVKSQAFHGWPLLGKPLSVLAQHASLGAQEAARRRWTPALVELIQRHHGDCRGERKGTEPEHPEISELLTLLQKADNRC